MNNIESMNDLSTYEETLRRLDRKLWLEAMHVEFAALQSHQSWIVEGLPDGAKAIKNKLCFKTNRTEKLTAIRHV